MKVAAWSIAPLAFALFCLIVSASARAGAVVGATEFTQIANNIELVETYRQEILQKLQMIESVKALKADLERLDPSTLRNLNANSLRNLDDLMRVSKKLTRTAKSSGDSLEVLRRHLREIDLSGLTPDEYLKKKEEIAAAGDDVAKASLEADTQTLQRLQQDSQDLEKTIASAPQIKSSVGGFQALLGANGRMQSQLVQLNTSIARANIAANSRAEVADAQRETKEKREADRRAAYFKSRNDALKKLSERKVDLPDPGKFSTIEY